MSAERVAYWRGKPIDDLSREELVEALNEVACLYRELLESSGIITSMAQRRR